MRLGDYVNIRTGKLDANASSENGQYPFFTCSVTPLKIDFYSYDCECVLVAGNGDLNVKYYNGKFDAYQRTYIIESKDKRVLSVPYLYCFLDKYVETLRKQAIGGVIKYIKLGNLTDAKINIPTIEEQKSVVSVLNKVNIIIDDRKKQLSKLDELVKARFVELFGDPTIANKDKAYMPMTSICEIIDGDRGKNYPKQEEFYEDGYCLFLNAKNVTSNGFDFTNCMFITKDKDELLRKGKLKRGDVVLTTRGTIGNLAYYSDDVPFDNVRINSGMVILRMNHELVDEIFFIEQFKLQLAEIKEKIASGSAQPQLPISTMNKIQMLVPEITKQIDFTNFVKQTDKSKLEVQKSLEKLELLKKALMQKYFG